MHRAVLIALLLAACGEKELDTDITRNPDRGLVRVFVLADGAPSLDVVVTREEEAPVAFSRLASPAATVARGQVVGDVSAELVLGGRSLEAAPHTLAKDRVSSVFFSGSVGTPDSLTARWVDESLPTATDKAHVRFVQATTQTVSAVRVDGTTIATAPASGEVGAFVAVAPTESTTVTVETDAGSVTFSGLRFGAGAVRTVALIPGGLALFDETATGAPEVSTVEPDAPTPP